VPSLFCADRGQAAAQEATTRPIRLFGRTFDATLVGRAALAGGHALTGPAVDNQMDATTQHEIARVLDALHAELRGSVIACAATRSTVEIASPGLQ
jgi:hypothetical protein